MLQANQTRFHAQWCLLVADYLVSAHMTYLSFACKCMPLAEGIIQHMPSPQNKVTAETLHWRCHNPTCWLVESICQKLTPECDDTGW